MGLDDVTQLKYFQRAGSLCQQSSPYSFSGMLFESTLCIIRVNHRSSGEMCVSGRVLIVEDDAGVRDSFVRMFAKAGYQTHAVEDGEAAERVLRRQFFPLVVFGLKHRGKNGLDTLKQLRVINPVTRILAVTAYSDLLPREAVLLAGAFDYLRKPVRRADLLKSAQRAIESVPDEVRE